MASPPAGRSAARASLLLLAALLVVEGVSSAAPAAPAAVPCPHSCRCFKADNLTAANCSSLSGLAGDATSHLRVLRLSGFDEHLSVRAGAFSNAPHLQQLYLDRLGLTGLHAGAFHGLNYLDTLSVSDNALSDADEISRVLRELPNLRRMILRGNNLCRDPVLLPNWHSRSLKHLDIGRCKLSALPVNAFTGLSHLRHIVLDGNFVRDFRATAFPKSIVSIDISNNDIERFTRSEVSKLPHLDVIEIGGNPVRCSCELYTLANDYNMNKAVTCASPKTLLGKNLLEVKKVQVCGHTKKVKREVTEDDYVIEDDAQSGSERDNHEEDADATNIPDEKKKTDSEANEEGGATGSEEENPEEEKVEAEEDKEENREQENVAEGDADEDREEDKTSAVENEEDKTEEVKEDNGRTDDEIPEEEKEEAGETVPDAEHERVDGNSEDVETVHNEESAVSNEEGAHLKNVDNEEKEGKAVENEDTEDDSVAETVGDDRADGETGEDKVNEGEETPKDVNEEVGEHESEDGNVVIDDVDKKSEEEESAKETIDKIDDVFAAEREEEEAAERGDEEELKKFLGATEEKPVGGEDGNEDEAEENDNTADAKAEVDESAEEGGESKNTENKENEDASLRMHAEGESAENIEESEKDTEAEDVENGDVLPSLETREGGSEAAKEPSAEDVEDNGETKDVADEKNEDVDEEGDDEMNLTHHLPEAIEENGGELETGDRVEEEAAGPKSKENVADGNDGIDDDVENTATFVDGEEERGAPFKSAVAPIEETEKETAHRVIPEAEDRENDLFGEDEEDPKHRHPDLDIHEDNDDDVEAVVDESGKIERTSDVGARAETGDAAENVAEEDKDEDEGAAGGSEDAPEATEEETSDTDKAEDDVKEDEDVKEDAGEEMETDGGAGATSDGDVDKEEKETAEKPESTDENEEDLGAARAVDADDEDDYEEEGDELKGEAAETAAENVDAAVGGETESGKENLSAGGDGDSASGAIEEDEYEDPVVKTNFKETEAEAEEKKEVPPLAEEYEDEDVETVTEDSAPDLIPGGSIAEAKGGHLVEGSGDEDGDGAEGDGTDSAEEETDKATTRKPVDDYDYEEKEETDTTPAPKKPSGDFLDTPVGYPTEEDEEEKEAASGAGSVPVIDTRGEDDELSGEEEQGSGDGHNFPVVLSTPVPEHDVKEESSGDYGHVSGFDDDSGEASTERIEHDDHEEVTPMPPPMVDENESEEDTLSGFIPSERQEDEIHESEETESPIIRTHVVKDDAPVMPTKDEDTGVDEVEEGEKEDDGHGEVGIKEEADPSFASERPSDRGRALVPPPVGAAPAAPASPTGETRMNEDLREGESESKESEALLGNNIGSYAVLGVIMVIIVALLAYAVIRSRRQKKTKGKKNDADLENGGARELKELQDVSKPLINNHHPNGTAVGGDKQRLEDETREPLMTKEQEASLSVEPEDKIDGPKKLNGGVIPEVVVEARPAPAGAAKTPTKTPPPTPVDVAPPAPVNGKATTPSDAPVNGINGAATPLVNGGTSPDAAPAMPPAPQQHPVSPGAVRVVAKELPDSVAKKPIIITNRGADPAQQV